ncbi:MAG: histidine kinase N-terminal domain-containing protein, partial [Actinomycetota bacterium]
QTLYDTDLVSTMADLVERETIDKAFRSQKVVSGETKIEGRTEPVNLVAIPVRFEDRVIAVLTREWSQRSGRKPGQLERTYLAIFDDFTKMIAA